MTVVVLVYRIVLSFVICVAKAHQQAVTNHLHGENGTCSVSHVPPVIVGCGDVRQTWEMVGLSSFLLANGMYARFS